jgi:hypothetical protein
VLAFPAVQGNDLPDVVAHVGREALRLPAPNSRLSRRNKLRADASRRPPMIARFFRSK